MPSGVAICAPLGVEEMLDTIAFGLEGLLVFGVGAAIPACPDGRGVDVGNVACEVAAADGGKARWIELMGESVEPLQVLADGGLVDSGVLGGPVVFFAETPEQNAGMVVVLRDHVAQGAAAH